MPRAKKPKMTKAAFVREHCEGLTSQEAADKATAAGYPVTKDHVNTIRWVAKHGRKPRGKRPKRPKALAKRVRAVVRNVNVTVTEEIFALFIREIGPKRALELVALAL